MLPVEASLYHSISPLLHSLPYIRSHFLFPGVGHRNFLHYNQTGTQTRDTRKAQRSKIGSLSGVLSSRNVPYTRIVLAKQGKSLHKVLVSSFNVALILIESAFSVPFKLCSYLFHYFLPCEAASFLKLTNFAEHIVLCAACAG